MTTKRADTVILSIDPQQMLDQIFSESHSFMTILSVPDFRYLKANAQHLKLIGKTDIIGKSIFEVEPNLATQGIFDLLKEVADSGKTYVGREVPIEYPARESEPARTAFLDFVYQPLRGPSGNVYAIAAQGHDVTEKVLARRKLEQTTGSIENERENFRNLFRQTPEMVVILEGPRHRFTFVNEAHIKVLGFDATGMEVRAAQPESIEVHGLLDNVYQTGVTAELREIPVTIGNEVRYFNLTYAARRNENDVIDGIMVMGVEVTDRKGIEDRLKKSEDRYRQLFDYSPLPKWIIDVETLRFIDVNNAAVKHYGFSKEEFLSMSALDIRPPEDIPGFIEVMKKDFSIDQSDRTSLRRHRKKDGTIIEVEMSGLDLTIDGRVFRIAAVNDVTERVRSDQLQKELMASLQAAKDEAERANRLKSAFLANMSHEIRTPLGAMIGFSDLIKDPELSSQERSSYVDIVTRNGEQLSYIINDILDLSKVEAGHLTFEFTDTSVDSVCAEVISLLSVKAKEKELLLEYEMDPSTPKTVVTDRNRLRQILLNLVGNAIKFTPAGSVKLRSYKCKSKRGLGSVCFEVIDTGIGISKAHQSRLFEMFVQGDDSVSRRFGGTGLGLALSRRLARELGGDIYILNSVEGEGTSFKVEIEDHPERRMHIEESKTEDYAALSEQTLEGVQVLIVDDSPDNQQLIELYLSKRGALVEFADDGLSGYRKAITGNYDLVLMDIQMPGMDGYTATQKLRAAGYRKPIIALTAHAMSEVRLKCLNVGCTDHLTKPINSKELIGVVAKHATTHH